MRELASVQTTTSGDTELQVVSPLNTANDVGGVARMLKKAQTFVSQTHVRNPHATEVSAVYSTRLYAVVQRAITLGLTKAAWPVWGARLQSLCHSAAFLEQRGRFRLPTIYRMSVQWVVSLTIACDVFVVGTVVGRLFQTGYTYAWFDAIFASIVSCVVVTFVFLLVCGCTDMELPLGSDAMDLPGLSYVAGAAHTTLGMVTPRTRASSSVLHMLTADVDRLYERVVASQAAR